MLAVIDLVESAAVIVLAVLFLALLGNRLENRPLARGVAIGLAFGAVGIVTMFSPVELAPGFRVDARNVVVAMAVAVGGPVAGAITAGATALTRAYFGGAGAVPGTVSIWLVAIFSTLLWLWQNHSRQRLSPAIVAGYAAIAAAVPLISVHFLTPTASPDLARAILTYIMPTNFFGTLFAGALILGEMQRRWAVTALRESQAQLQTIANNAPGVLFQLTLGRSGYGRFKYVSGSSRRILGVEPDELTGNPEAILRMMSAEDVDTVNQLLKETARTGEPWSIEAQFQRSDGRHLWMLASAEPRTDSDGRLVWDGSLFDISERRQSEQMKTEFISTVSHELRTPLTSIRGSLGLISSGAAGVLPAKAERLIAIAHSNSERLVRLINDILDIEKIESGRMAFDIRPHALAPVIAQSIEASRSYMVERQVTIEFDDAAPGAVAAVDPDRVNQVMLNLLSNAIKHAPQASTVSVDLLRTQAGVRLSVRDRGPGIPLEFRDRIFGRFEQADSTDARSKGGTGLGLSIVKAIVGRLGGTVGFETELGAGTVFHVDLPEIRSEPADLYPFAGGDEADVAPRVLICEDEPDIAQLIAMTLADEGLQSDIALDVATARAMLAKTAYTAMTLDIRLAGESGLALMREVRKTEAGAHLPVIIVSAHLDDAKTSLNGSALGVVDWIEKPVEADRLKAVLANLRKGTFARAPSVLHVEDDEDVLDVVATALGPDLDVTPARTAREARRLLATRHYDIVILDLDLPDGAGQDLLESVPSKAAVVIFSAYDIEQQLAARVRAAMTKTRSSELAIAELVRTLVLPATGE